MGGSKRRKVQQGQWRGQDLQFQVRVPEVLTLNLLASLCSLWSPVVYAHCGASGLGSLQSICNDEGESSWGQDDIMVEQ